MQYVEAGELSQALTSLCSDLGKHSETERHPAIGLGMTLMFGGHLTTAAEMRRFIKDVH